MQLQPLCSHISRAGLSAVGGMQWVGHTLCPSQEPAQPRLSQSHHRLHGWGQLLGWAVVWFKRWGLSFHVFALCKAFASLCSCGLMCLRRERVGLCCGLAARPCPSPWGAALVPGPVSVPSLVGGIGVSEPARA